MSLRVYLLGPMRAFDGVEAIRLPPRSKLQSLWAYLLVHRDRSIPRNLLAFTFWPDQPETEARLNLRRHLHRLQQLLPSASDLPWILADHSTVQWNPAADTWIDLAEFDRTSGDPDLQTAAIGLYQGDLLEGIYDDWVFAERERIREVCFRTLQAVVQRVERDHDHLRAFEVAQRLLRLDPLSESTYRTLMRLHAHSGDRAGVVRTFNACQTVLRRELGVDPSAETHRDYQAYLAEEPPRPGQRSPSPASEGGSSHNLPRPLTSFFGREDDMDAIRNLLGKARLVTLTGVGGVGKTRLALATAETVVDRFPDGVWWVDLAPLVDPSLLGQAFASALGLREQSSRPIVEALSDAIRTKDTLLVIDNCEHLVAACAELVDRLLARAASVRFLATSTEPLGVPGETVWQVPPLGLPSPETLDDEDAAEVPASVRLFVDRATAALPTFRLTPADLPAVARLCRALDGIPLALELAAARLKVLNINQLVERLDDRFRLLTGGSRTGLPRHRTMAAVLDWSYGLLEEAERALLRRLSLFVGGFTLESAESVCGGDPIEQGQVLRWLSELVDKSMVTVSRADPAHVRYGLLETVGHYARVKLIESGEAEEIRRRFAAYFVGLVERAGERLLRGPDQERWFWAIGQEYDNLRGAIGHAEGAGELATPARIAARLWPFWWTRGLVAEGRQVLESLLPRREALDPRLRAMILHAAGRLMMLQGEYDPARDALEESLQIYRDLGERAAIADTVSSLGVVASYTRDYDQADGLWKQALEVYEALEDRWGVARALNNLGDLAVYRADFLGAVEHLERSVGLFRELRSTLGESIGLINLGRAVFLLGETDRAAGYFRQSLEIKVDLADQEGIAWNLEGLAGVAAAAGDPRRAARLFGAAERLRQVIGIPIAAPDRPFHEQNVARARSQIDDVLWQALWAEGATMPAEKAIVFALREPERS